MHFLLPPGCLTVYERAEAFSVRCMLAGHAFDGSVILPQSVCTSVNEVICHGIPDKRPLQSGDIVNVDISAFYGGLHSDLNETFVVGEVDDASKKLVKVTHEVRCCLHVGLLVHGPSLTNGRPKGVAAVGSKANSVCLRSV